jgi:hypothetical protein
MTDEPEAAAAVAAPAKKPRRVLLVMITALNAMWNRHKTNPNSSMTEWHVG